jgi:hypothetical protein
MRLVVGFGPGGATDILMELFPYVCFFKQYYDVPDA